MDEFERMLKDMKKEVGSPIVTIPPSVTSTTQEQEKYESSVPPIPYSVGFTSVMSMLLAALPMIIKNLPLILGVLGGLSKFFSTFKPAPGNPEVVIDQESLAKLIEEITEREVHRIVNSHKEKIKVWVPTDEDRERQARLDELEEILKKDKEEYEKNHPRG